MLNISTNSISDSIRLKDFSSYRLLKQSRVKRPRVWIISIIFLGLFLCLFLPWMQNINAKGYVTTRGPQQRPQAIQSVIAGQLEQWYVQEGDFVSKGDTIVYISEVKSKYFDPNLLERTTEQITAKSNSVQAYDMKVQALQRQYEALNETLALKKQQTQNKILQAENLILIDSTDLVALLNNLAIMENQVSRTQTLYDKGLKSLSELQEKTYKTQEANAKVNAQKNKLLNQRNKLNNLHLEITTIEKEYADKLAKCQSDQQSAISAKMESMAATSKLQNEFSNYSERQKYYYVIAPQSGYVTKTMKKGLGEVIKEGADIVTIMPESYDVAVEVYVKPQDLPLLDTAQRVQLRFDGWPAIVISGWPESSTGVFTGSIVAIDRFISDNGYYRAIISPDIARKEWPSNLSIGTGTNAFILVKEVPIWYEIWRQLNGFPLDFYRPKQKDNGTIKRKAPIKSIK